MVVQTCLGNVVLHELQYNGKNQSTMVLSFDTIVVPWYYCGKSKETCYYSTCTISLVIGFIIMVLKYIIRSNVTLKHIKNTMVKTRYLHDTSGSVSLNVTTANGLNKGFNT